MATLTTSSARSMAITGSRLARSNGTATEPSGSLRQRVADAVEAAVGVAPDIELVSNEELLRQGPPHKIPRVTRQ